MKLRRAQLAACAALALAAAQAEGGSQMFKCIEGGRTIYQQRACAVTAQPESAASAPHATPKASSPVASASTGAAKVRQAPPAASPAPAARR